MFHSSRTRYPTRYMYTDYNFGDSLFNASVSLVLYYASFAVSLCKKSINYKYGVYNTTSLAVFFVVLFYKNNAKIFHTSKCIYIDLHTHNLLMHRQQRAYSIQMDWMIKISNKNQANLIICEGERN